MGLPMGLKTVNNDKDDPRQPLPLEIQRAALQYRVEDRAGMEGLWVVDYSISICICICMNVFAFAKSDNICYLQKLQ